MNFYILKNLDNRDIFINVVNEFESLSIFNSSNLYEIAYKLPIINIKIYTMNINF